MCDRISAGMYNNKVPVLMGSNRDEMALFLAQDASTPRDLNATMLRQLLLAKLPTNLQPKVDAILNLYAPGGTYPYPANLGRFSQSWWTAMRIETDAVPGLGVRNAAPPVFRQPEDLMGVQRLICNGVPRSTPAVAPPPSPSPLSSVASLPYADVRKF